MKVAIFTNSDKKSETIKNLLVNELVTEGFEIDDVNPEYVFMVGGDGTFLKAVQKYIDQLDRIKFVGISNGKLCFFYEYGSEHIKDAVLALKQNKLIAFKHNLIEAHVNKNGGDVTFYAVNEIRIENPFHTLTSEVYIDGKYLETFRGNGLVVASALGSSAYNRSLGGAIVSPNLDVLQITEIASLQNNVYRSLGSSLILSGKDEIIFRGDFENVIVGHDNLISPINNGFNQISFKLSEKKATICFTEKHSYIDKINKSFVR